MEDINADSSLKFVIMTGDTAELGTNKEYEVAKHILSKLYKHLYVKVKIMIPIGLLECGAFDSAFNAFQQS